MRGERFILASILTAIGLVLAYHPDQPIVENYVGRQIPTAMVARNLERGSDFLRPTLDTAPFPNLFLVEPPIYAQAVAGVAAGVGFVWSWGSAEPLGFVWELSGRLTSALLTVAGAWAFYGLVRRREGPAVALIALASFGLMPVTLRYGRAFQPDAAMLGFVLLGLRGWDEYEAGGSPRWGWLGFVALAMGLAIKITAAWALIPFFLLVNRLRLPVRLALAGLMLVPAVAWYVHAWQLLRPDSAVDGGSLASWDNALIWLQSLSPAGWLRLATWEAIGRNALRRAFTPLGLDLAVFAFWFVRARVVGDRLWLGWGVGCVLAIAALGAKWHHEYYWLVLAPLVAVGVARGLGAIARFEPGGRIAAAGLGSFGILLCGAQAASTWRTPPEWAAIRELGAEIAAQVPPKSPFIAPEAVLFYADRPGYRLEFGPEAVRRATGEWGRPILLDRAADPMALVDFYDDQFRLSQNCERRRWFVADVGQVDRDDRRAAWRAALRVRPETRIVVDRPELILAEIGLGRRPDLARPATLPARSSAAVAPVSLTP